MDLVHKHVLVWQASRDGLKVRNRYEGSTYAMVIQLIWKSE